MELQFIKKISITKNFSEKLYSFCLQLLKEIDSNDKYIKTIETKIVFHFIGKKKSTQIIKTIYPIKENFNEISNLGIKLNLSICKKILEKIENIYQSKSKELNKTIYIELSYKIIKK